MLQKADTSGYMMKYVIKLNAYGIHFQLRAATKVLFLIGFMNEYTGSLDKDNSEKPMWILHVDGSFTKERSSASLILRGPHDVKVSYALKLRFDTTNNEYEALIIDFKLAKDTGAEKTENFSDTMLVIQQLKDKYEAKGEGMI